MPVPSALGQMIWSGPGNWRVVALTFDDGPRLDGSPELLDILDKYGVKATFFVIGNEAEQNPDIVYRMYDSGDEIGNHTYAHTRLGDVPLRELVAGIGRTNDIVEKITGVRPKCFRPPGGSMSPALSADLARMHMELIGWTINAEDYTEFTEGFEIEENYTKVAGELRDKVLAGVRPGAIILLHNSSKQTILALPEIIEGLRKKGYGFVTVSELIARKDY